MSIANPRFTAIKTAMLLHVPFFASLMMDLMDIKIGKFPELFGLHKNTAATDGKAIFFDEDWLSQLSVADGVFVTCHEIAHAMWDHMARAKYYVDLGFDGEKFSPRLWNVAADFVINDMLIKSGYSMPTEKDPETGATVPVGIHDPKYTSEMGVEEVYRDLRKQQKGKGKGKGKGEGGGEGEPGDDDQDGFDTHIYKSGEVSPAEMKRVVQSAINNAKALGKLPAGLERLAEELLEAKVDWRERLRHIVTTRTQRETSTWTMPHKRRLTSQGIYLARPSGYGCGTIVWVFDTSGSIGPKDLQAFGSEGADIMRSCRPERVILLGADAEVASVTEFDGEADLTADMLTVKGGGGTDFRPAFRWLEEQGIVPDALIYFTDGYGAFPDAPMEYPVIWAMTTDVPAPWGDHVKVEL